MTTQLRGFSHRFVPATRPGLPAAAAAARHRRERGRSAPARRAAPARGRAAEPARPACSSTACRDSSAAWRRACSISTTCGNARSSSPTSSTEARVSYDLGPLPPVAVGFSNGANIAAAMLLLRPGTLGGALLIRPMVPLVPDPLPALAGVPVQINAGTGRSDRDPGAERSAGRAAASRRRRGVDRLDSGQSWAGAAGSGCRGALSGGVGAGVLIIVSRSVFLLYRVSASRRNRKRLPRARLPGVWRRPLSPPAGRRQLGRPAS